MEDRISVSNTSVTYQAFLLASVVMQGKVPYVLFQGEFEENGMKISYRIRMKKNTFTKKQVDIIKDKYTIFQNRMNACYLLYNLSLDEFEVGEDGKKYHNNKVHTSEYDYTIQVEEIELTPEEQAAIDNPAQKQDRYQQILAQYGLNLKEEKESVVDDFMKTWKLGNPDK